MNSEPERNEGSTATNDFERELRTFVLEAFARGTAVEGTWDVESASEFVPGWRITIEKVDGAEPPRDPPAFVDE